MIPIVQVLTSGKEVVVGQATTMKSAENLLLWFAGRYPNRDYYIDCADEVPRSNT